MKKLLSLVLVIVMVAAMFGGCGGGQEQVLIYTSVEDFIADHETV